MGRANLRMELIENEKSRELSFEKRRNSLKKAYELHTLCEVEVGIIIYSPSQPPRRQDKDRRPMMEGEAWPANHPGHQIDQIMGLYRRRSKQDRKCKTLDSSNFFTRTSTSTSTSTSHEAVYPSVENCYNGLEEQELRQLCSALETKIQAANFRIAALLPNPISTIAHSLAQTYGCTQNQNQNHSAYLMQEQDYYLSRQDEQWYSFTPYLPLLLPFDWNDEDE